MTTFLITMFVIHILAVGIHLHDLTNRSYPFTKTRSKSDDVAALVVAVVFSVWCGVLLF